MAEYKHLSKAPINEALIDIRVGLPREPVTHEAFQKLEAKIGDTYPSALPIQTMRIEFFPGNPPTEKKETKFEGFRFTSSNQLQVVQATPDAFTFSRLRPYETWENLQAEAQKCWSVYNEVFRPQVITRVATRFINALEIPLPFTDFSEYLNGPPNVPSGLPQAIAGFFTRVVFPDLQTGATAIITQSLESVVGSTSLKVLLDIDVILERSFDTQDNQQEAWTTIGKLRDLKNKIFFESVTEKSLRPYI